MFALAVNNGTIIAIAAVVVIIAVLLWIFGRGRGV